MKYPYYEVCIGPGPFLPGDDSSFWMCIHGVRQPTPAEAEQFLAEDVKTYGGTMSWAARRPGSSVPTSSTTMCPAARCAIWAGTRCFVDRSF